MKRMLVKMRTFKGGSNILALLISIYAYNDHDGFYFAPLMAVFVSVITGLLTIEYWHDRFLRVTSGTVFLCTLNNLADELFFDPYTFGMNEKMFAVIIALNFIYNLIYLSGSSTAD